MSWIKHALLQPLNAKAHAVLAEDIHPVTLTEGEVLFEPGQILNQIWFLQSGLVSLITLLQDGRRIDGITVGRRGALGLPPTLGSGRVISRAQVHVAGEAFRVSGDACRRAMALDEGFNRRLMRYYEAIFSAVVQLMVCSANHTLEQRLCRWLLSCQDQLGSDVLPFRQETVSSMLGVNRTSLVSTSRLLQKDQAILVRHGRIQVLSSQRLRQRACECYEVTSERFRAIVEG